MGELADLIRERASIVQETMLQAAAKAGRKDESTRLLVVTKRQSVETIQAAIKAGLSYFGENYPEEASAKLSWFKNHSGIHWEMIGHIQSRKANLVAEGYDLIHSIDSLKLASKIDHLRQTIGGFQRVLLEINIAAEDNKSGYRLDSNFAISHFFDELEGIAKLEYIKVTGLMGMPPLQQNSEDNRVYFAELRKLQEKINSQFGWKMHELSIGTSSDYWIAIEEGATVVRIGEAILGKRK